MTEQIIYCSDDPVLMKKSLTDNFIKVINEYSWTEKDITKILANAVNSGFYRSPEQEKTVKELFREKGLKL